MKKLQVILPLDSLKLITAITAVLEENPSVTYLATDVEEDEDIIGELAIVWSPKGLYAIYYDTVENIVNCIEGRLTSKQHEKVCAVCAELNIEFVEEEE